jgi:N6-adenosine-specific RNA methylase IME4
VKKYNIIYADPPWTYDDKCHSGERGVEYKYDCMDIEEIKKLPVEEIAENNCTLFMWVTWPMIAEGLDVIKAWGFKYKTIGFVWIKLNKIAKSLFWGMGNWTRSNSEICLLAVRGKPKRVSKGVHSVIMSVIEKHSKKPDETRTRIITLMGDLPRIELFARQSSSGWDVWGNEINCDIELTI